jgi:transcriptional regulator with XRE-family HTH domain
VKSTDLRDARLAQNWSQTEVAARLGVSQAYVNMLERGKRKVTRKLTRKLVEVYGLSPEVLPISDAFDENADTQSLTESLARLGYPGFAYLGTKGARKNPAEVLLSALAKDTLDPRVAEALPWVPLRFWRMDCIWLLDQARKRNLQNRLGFVVSIARQLSERDGASDERTRALRELEARLEESRLAKVDFFYRPPRTPGEREWLQQNRPEAAKHWNLMADLRAEHLEYAP